MNIMPFDRVTIKKHLFSKLKGKVKEAVLLSNIEGLVDEYIEKKSFLQEHGTNIKDLPSKDDMKWWFQEKVDTDSVVLDGTHEDLYEINIDNICLKDKLAHSVFTELNGYTWSPSQELSSIIKKILKLCIIANDSDNIKLKNNAKNRLSNIALVGTIRHYKLERKPYLTKKQINECINHFRKSMSVIEKCVDGEYKDKKVVGELYIFSGLEGNING